MLTFYFAGNFHSWEDAFQESNGYSEEQKRAYLEKIKNAVLKVKSGEAVYERDSELLDRIEYSYPVLVYLLFVASAKGNMLNLLDFGGSLGSSFFQCRNFLAHLDAIKWNVVEQEHYVSCGKKFIEDDQLKFFYSIEQCCNKERPDAILISGVIQYLEDPYDFFNRVFSFNIEYIIIDRTPFINGEDRITHQVVDFGNGAVSYPAWFLQLDKFQSFLSREYELLDHFDSFESTHLDDGTFSQSKGFLFRRKK